MNLLFLPGPGIDASLLEPFSSYFRDHFPEFKLHVVYLSGFTNPAIPTGSKPLDVYMEELESAVSGRQYEPWLVYGQGAGAAIAAELASRSFEFPGGSLIMPDKIILQGALGQHFAKGPFQTIGLFTKAGSGLFASFAHNKLMQTAFAHPQNIQEDVRKRFLQNIQDAGIFARADEWFDSHWYEHMRYKVETHRFTFIQGEFEPGVDSKVMIKTKGDFPGASIRIVKGWKQYPMIEYPEFFADYLMHEVILEEKQTNIVR